VCFAGQDVIHSTLLCCLQASFQGGVGGAADQASFKYSCSLHQQAVQPLF
jgi:hypothetical protein